MTSNFERIQYYKDIIEKKEILITDIALTIATRDREYNPHIIGTEDYYLSKYTNRIASDIALLKGLIENGTTSKRYPFPPDPPNFPPYNFQQNNQDGPSTLAQYDSDESEEI